MSLAAALSTAAACKFPPLADVPDDDVAPMDGAVATSVDGAVRDHPLVQDNQAADLVIGQQRDLTTAASSLPGGPHWLTEPRDVALVDGALFVADGANQRVLVFDPIPSSSLADVTLAQQALLFVGDGDNNQALRYRLDLP